MIFGEQATQFLAIATTIGGSLMGLAYFFQLHKIIKRKSSDDISLVMFVAAMIVIALWFSYGLAIDNKPLIYTNIIGGTGIAAILIATLKYRKK
jgi:MtN3 and saliva related transmembrane protein